MNKHGFIFRRGRVWPIAYLVLATIGTAFDCLAQAVVSPPYVSPDTPQGTGPHPAVIESALSLATHTIYRPKDFASLGSQRLPILVFANGACANRGNSFRYFLTEIASHGLLAIAIGPIGPIEGEYEHIGNGQPAAGSPAAALAAAGKLPAATPASGPTPAYTTASQLIEALDWAQAENLRRGGLYYGRLDTARTAVMGMSCGGLQALDAVHDPRVTTLGVWNSGTYSDDRRALEIAAARATKAGLKALRVPTLYVTGDPSDIAFANTEDDFARIDGVPLFRAWREKTGHGGTYREPNGGEFGRVAVAWLRWQLKGDKDAAKMFIGADCGICKLPNWHVKKKNIE